jgi:hypothetical protein
MDDSSPTPSGAAPAAPVQPWDLQPILERGRADAWSLASRASHELYAAFQGACETEGIRAMVVKSDPFVYPVQVKFECWIPKEGRSLTDRTSAVITIEPKPFHKYPLEYKLEIDDRGKKQAYAGLWQFTPGHAWLLVRYLLRRVPRPSFDAIQLRRYNFQFWRPTNEVNALRYDWTALIPLTILLFGAFALCAGGDSGVTMPGLILITGGALSWYFLAGRETSVRCLGKPEAEPRHLLRVDSWQAVVTGLGDASQLLRERFLKILEPPFTKGFRQHVERIWRWGLEGKEEREQFVLTLGRAILFCQIYQYGRELYVGWDGHLNIGQWVEKTVATGIDKSARCRVSINAVVPGYQDVTEYDISDLNCLIEWTHAQLTKLVRELMEERKIDQEIDFKIQRGERQHLTHEERTQKVKEKARGLRRTK